MAELISFRGDVDEVDRQASVVGLSRSEYLRALVEGQSLAGVWVVGYYGAEPHSIHPNEIDALRQRAEGFGQYVMFWPWGTRPEIP